MAGSSQYVVSMWKDGKAKVAMTSVICRKCRHNEPVPLAALPTFLDSHRQGGCS